MHAVLITFKSSAPVDQLEQPFREYAEALCGIGGLIAKTWIKDGETLGGFHVFTSRATADAYLGSEMVAGLTSNPAFENFTVDHYDVLEELSFITGTPRRQLATV